MTWKKLEAEWDSNPEFRKSYEEEYPFEAVARAIVRLRVERGLTQDQMARLAGTSQSVIARAETGRHAVNVRLLNRLAEATGTTWEPVFGPQPMPQVAPAPQVGAVRSGLVFSEAVLDLVLSTRSPALELLTRNLAETGSFYEDLHGALILGEMRPKRPAADEGQRQPALALAG